MTAMLAFVFLVALPFGLMFLDHHAASLFTRNAGRHTQYVRVRRATGHMAQHTRARVR